MDQLKAGDKVYVPKEKRPYRVRCRSDRYIICTKPFNPKRTVLYFIIDLKQDVRGPDDRIFCCGYETDRDCEERLEELERGEIEVSWRNRVPLDCYTRRKKDAKTKVRSVG